MSNDDYRWPKGPFVSDADGTSSPSWMIMAPMGGKEQAQVDKCVESDKVELEKEGPYTIIEHENSKVDFQKQIEVKELSEELSIIEETSGFSEDSVKEIPHVSNILEEIPHHESTEDVPQNEHSNEDGE
ncbi:hypothetical protein PVK06_034388 [Gossypium arboreum]|uniref:Uncharacterized protein n=1 Tax=Gossypium arboreum TaxID=29729 RepID=A0ABR0NGY8_GOSAR|nr:hypothetical protein PVK06_034388 [Gossypium arboreum]